MRPADGSTPPTGQGATALREAIFVVIAAILVFAPLAIGTVHTPTRLAVFAACALAFILTLVERLRAERRIAVTVPTVALAVATIATALQLIPLPASVVAVLSPVTQDLYAQVDAQAAHPLTLDTAATVRELAKLGAYLAFFTAAVTYASSSQRRWRLVFTVAATATLVAVIGLGQAALGVRRVLFFYTPESEWATLVRGTFVSPNHFGALLALGAPCTLAIAMRQPRWRRSAAVATFILNIAAVLSLSRSGIAATFIGQALTFAFDRLQLRRGSDWLRSRTATLGMLGIAIVCAVVVAVTIGKSQLTAVLRQTENLGEEIVSPLSKFHVWERSAALVWDAPWTGIGRGAFELAYPRVADVGGILRYQWMEDGYLQTVVDFGVPVALLLFLLAGWALVLAVRRVRDDPMAIGVLASIIALAIHEVADFAVELPGVALPALALLATLFGRRSTEAEQGRRRVTVRLAYLAVPVLLLAPAAFEPRMPTAAAEAAALSVAVNDRSVTTDKLIARGEAVRRRHPADYFTCLVVAGRLVREHHPDSLRWLNDAMTLDPTHPLPHLMAAEFLAAAHRKAQALVEFRLATAGAADPRREVWPYVVARYPTLDDLLAATPDENRYLGTLGKWLISTGRPADAEIVYQRFLERDPRNARALTILAELAISRKDARAAAERSDALAEIEHDPAAQRLQIRTRVVAGDLDAAARQLDAMGDRGEGAFAVELELGQALANTGRTDAARTRLDRLLAWRLDPQARVRLHEIRADIEHKAGNEHQYRWELEQRDRILRP